MGHHIVAGYAYSEELPHASSTNVGHDGWIGRNGTAHYSCTNDICVLVFIAQYDMILYITI